MSHEQAAVFPWVSHYAEGTRPEISKIEFPHLSAMFKASVSRYGHQVGYVQYMPNGMTADLTFQQMDQLSTDFAVILREKLKLQAGDRVAIQLPNCLSYPIAVYGILKAGLVLVNTNPLYTAPEMNYQFKDSGVKAIIVMDMFADRLPAAIEGTAVQHVIVVTITEYFGWFAKSLITAVLKYVKRQVPPNQVPHQIFSELMRIAHAERGQQTPRQMERYLESVNLDSTAALQYTGGTTGVSKAAVLTHHNLIANGLQVLEMVKCKVDPGKEVILTALPLYHIFAFTINLITFGYAGGKSILIPSPRPLTNLKKVLTRLPITWITGVNTLFNGLCGESWFQARPPRHLKAGVAGGMALHRAVAERWQQIVGSSIVEGYGLTEASPVLNVNPIGGEVREGSVGIPIPSTDVCCQREDGTVAAIDEAGELCARGPQIMKEYWNRPDETAQVLVNGWLHTGDIAVMDKDGYFTIVDRKKDMILVSGFNVYPNEVEDCIAKHPKVLEVAVVGVPDQDGGELVRAFVHPKDDSITAVEIREHCRKFLTGYKIPKSIIFKKDLPKSPIGKILRKDLKKEAVLENGRKMGPTDGKANEN